MRKSTLLAIIYFLSLGAIFFVSNIAYAAPASPSGVSASTHSACVIDLSWDQSFPGADYFAYQRSTNNFQSFVTLRKPTSGSLPGAPAIGNFTNESSNLIPGTTYWYQVRACDNLNLCSPYVASVPKSLSASSLPSAPSVPSITGAIADVPSGSALQDITISWSATTKPSTYGGFSIFRSKNGGAFSFLGALPLTNPNQPLSYRDLGLDPSSNYSYRVYAYDSDYGCPIDASDTSGPKAVNQAVYSGASASVTVPERPTSLIATLNSGAVPSITLSWGDNSANETAFEILKSVDPAFPPATTLVLSANQNATTLQDSSVNPSTAYYYKIRACVNANTCSAFSSVASVVTGLEAPTLFADLVHSSNISQKGDVYLFWQGVVGATSYSLQRSTSSVFDPLVAPTILLTTKSDSDEPAFYDTGVNFGDTYYYRVMATGGGLSMQSNIFPINIDIVLTLKGVGWSAQKQGSGSGYSGIGWIKFDSLSEQGSPTSLNEYSVQADSSGLVSGEAWASVASGLGYGWLSFNKGDLGGCPTAPCEARFDSATNRFSGWARFLTPQLFPGLGSWDGWVKLSGNSTSGFLSEPIATLKEKISKTPFVVFRPFLEIGKAEAASAYGVMYDPSTRKLSGLAWGGDVGGWIAFGSDSCTNSLAPCTVRADVLNQPPQASTVTAILDPSVWCADDGKNGGTDDIAFHVNWSYTDPENDAQSFAEVRFTNTANSSDEVTVVSPGINISLRYADPLGWVATGGYGASGYLKPGKTYFVSVRVNDGNSFSTWSQSANNVTMPAYYYPLVDFDWTPQSPATSSPARFSDKSIDRSAGASPSSGWVRAWQFANGSPAQSTIASPTVSFSKFPSDAALSVTDSAGTCSYQKTVGGGGTNPNTPLKRRQFKEK